MAEATAHARRAGRAPTRRSAARCRSSAAHELDGRRMTSVGRYTFASWLRRGIGTRITAARPARRRRLRHPRARHRADRRVAQRRGHLQELRADRAGRHHRHQPGRWSCAPSRATGSPTSSPTTSPSSSSTTRISSGATRPRKPTGEKLSPWLALLVLEAPDDEAAGRVRARQPHAIRCRRCPREGPAAGALPPLTQNWAFGHVQHQRGPRRRRATSSSSCSACATPGSAERRQDHLAG